MIITDESKLRVKCSDALSHEVEDIVAKLDAALELSGKNGLPGIGLSAPQIGIEKNVAIVRIDNVYNVNLVNCSIESCYDKALFEGEGCLSFPGKYEKTLRYQEIHVTNNFVYPSGFVAKGLFSVVIQHELEHLIGKLLPDVALKQFNLSSEHKSNKKLKPNEPCWCGKLGQNGNILKYKKCHGKFS